MGQLNLFDAGGPVNQYGAPIRLNPTVSPQDRARLSRQCLAILARLREGPATNADLVRIAQRFGARIQELRNAGFSIPDPERGDGGVFTYRLEA